MTKIPDYKLTKEYLAQYSRNQIDKYLSIGPVEEKLAEQYLAKAYIVAKLSPPKKYVWFDSPRGLITGASVRASVWDSVGDSVRASVWDSVWDSVRASVWDSVGDSVRASVRDSVWDSVRASVRDSVWDSVRASVWDSVGDSVRASVWDSVGAWSNSPYNSWFKFFNDEMEKNDFENICLFDEMVTGYILTTNTAYIVRKPIALRRDSNGRLDNDQHSAIKWADGFKFYYLHGVEFDYETWKKIVDQKITLETLGTIQNADQRAVAVQMLKPELLLAQVKAKHLHTGKKGTKLYEVKNFMDTGRTEYCMWMKDASTPREFIEWIEPSIGKQGDADFCQATALGLPLEDYLNMELEA